MKYFIKNKTGYGIAMLIGGLFISSVWGTIIVFVGILFIAIGDIDD